MPDSHVSMRLASLVAGAGLIAFGGCSSTAAEVVAVTHPTMIEVSPEDFLGDVPCSSSDGGLKRYVATLFDINQTGGGFGGAGGDAAAGASDEGDAGGAAPAQFQLPSSLPTPCLAAVGFGFVVAARHYRVEIDGYDSEDLAPRAIGARQMVSPPPSDDEPVTPLLAPRWTARCERAIAVDSTIVRADHCTPFSAGAGAGASASSMTGALRIGLGPLLGDLQCGSKPGEVEQLNVSVVVGAGDTRMQSVACSPKAEALFSKLPARRHVSVYVAAESANADPTRPLAGARCDGNVLPDAAVDAQCSQLSQVGTLRVDLPGALGLLALSCTATDVSNVVVEPQLPGEKPQSLLPPACLQPFDHGFPAGPAVVLVSASKGSEQLGALTCHAEVAPGTLVTATCERKPAE
jgi:hypothetical protein